MDASTQSSFSSGSSSDFGRSFGSQEKDVSKNRETTDTRQRSSRFSNAGRTSTPGNGNANLAAQRAIEQAQRERKAAQQRAADIMTKARDILEQQQSEADLAQQQEQIIASNEAVAAVLAELADQPEALQAFLSDGELVQKVMDKAVTLSEALEQVGADINEDTASAGNEAVAENNTPVVASEPETPEPAPAPVFIPKEIVKTQPLPTRPPKTPPVITQPKPDLADSGQSSASQPTVVDSQPEDDSLFSDGESSSPEPEQGLVHVAGNHYKLNGMDVWDMNYIPDPSEQQLDANGWPKYLSVPAACPPSRGDVDYYHEARLDASGTHVFSPVMQFRMNNYWDEQSWGYASLRVADAENNIKAEEVAAPFITPHTLSQITSGGSVHLNLADDYFVSSISYCPGDYVGVTPQGEVPLKRVCSTPLVDEDNKAKNSFFGRIRKIIALIDYAGEESQHCVIEPGKRYFYNFRTFADQNRIAEGIDPAPRPYIDKDGNIAEMPIAGRIAQSGMTFDNYKSTKHLPPYANACVEEGEMFPLNYSNDISEKWDTIMCGRAIFFSNGCEGRGGLTTCYDKTGHLPPVVFETQCIGGHMTWIKGYGEKVFSNYDCEKRTTDGKFFTSYPSESFFKFRPVCAAHREDEVRKSVRLFGSTNYRIRIAEQCQFDEDLGRFDWHVVSSKGEHTSQSFSSSVPRRAIEPPNGQVTFSPPAHKQTCSWEGDEYPLGTKMVQTINFISSHNIRKGTHTYTCMKRAPAPALPRFVHDTIKASPEPQPTLRTDRYSVTFE